MSIIALALWSLLSLALIGPSALSADEEMHRYSLRELIDSAMANNTEIEEGTWKVRGESARLRQANALRFLPRLRLESESGLVPEAKGDVLNPPSDSTGYRPLGPFSRTQLEFVQPLYTFGQLSNLRRAAAGGLKAEKASLEQTRLEITFAVKELFYGVLLAQDLQTLVERLSDTIDQELGDLPDDALSLSDSYKLKLALLELEAQRGEAARQLELARAALAWHTGLPADPPLMLETQWLAPVEAAVPPLDQLGNRALTRRPDWRQLQAGLAARKAQVDAARSAYYPQIFLAGGLRYAAAPGRTDQHNPFVKDEFNYFNGGVFLGIQQSFEFGLLGAQVDKARATFRQLKAKERSAEQGILLDIQQAYYGYQQAEQDLDKARQGRQLGRQWMKLAQEEYEFDPDTLKDLITAFEAWARLEQSYYEAIYDFNVRFAELEKKAGGIPLNEQP